MKGSIKSEGKKKQVAEFIGYIVMPYNKFVSRHCSEDGYKFPDTMGLFKKDLTIGNPHGFIRQLIHWHPDTDWAHLMEVATFMVQEGIPVTILPAITPEAAWKEILKSLEKHLK